MTSNRLAIIFLGFVFIIIIILSSQKIAAFVRARLGNVLPSSSIINENLTPTPTSIPLTNTDLTITPIPTKKLNESKKPTNAPSAKEIPATGPQSFIYVLLGSSLAGGLILKRYK